MHFTHKVHYSQWKYSDSKLNNVRYSKGNQSVQHVHVQAHADIDAHVYVHVHVLVNVQCSIIFQVLYWLCVYYLLNTLSVYLCQYKQM